MEEGFLPWEGLMLCKRPAVRSKCVAHPISYLFQQWPKALCCGGGRGKEDPTSTLPPGVRESWAGG